LFKTNYIPDLTLFSTHLIHLPILSRTKGSHAAVPCQD